MDINIKCVQLETPKMNKQCAHCGKPFSPSYSAITKDGRKRGVFCSRECVHGNNYKGAFLGKDGYIRDRKEGKYAFQHRMVMEAHIGRGLLPTETVHHINRIRSDNRIENLKLMSRSEHQRVHAAECAKSRGYNLDTQKICRTCKKIKSRSEFSPNVSHGRPSRNSQCKPCAAEWQRNYNAKRRI